jgi:DNA-binding transcriptional regulator LsrR (DeoR family)
LARAIEKLPESERVATRMFYFEYLTQAEIATQLDIPEKTVKSRLHSARGRLKETLERSSPTLDRLARQGLLMLQVADHTTNAAQVVALPGQGPAISMAA